MRHAGGLGGECASHATRGERGEMSAREDERERAGGAEDERRELDFIESGLGSSNGNCPVNLQLMDRVFGYCELDVAAGEAKRSAGRERGTGLYLGLGVCVSCVYLYLCSV